MLLCLVIMLVNSIYWMLPCLVIIFLCPIVMFLCLGSPCLGILLFRLSFSFHCMHSVYLDESSGRREDAWQVEPGNERKQTDRGVSLSCLVLSSITRPLTTKRTWRPASSSFVLVQVTEQDVLLWRIFIPPPVAPGKHKEALETWTRMVEERVNRKRSA